MRAAVASLVNDLDATTRRGATGHELHRAGDALRSHESGGAAMRRDSWPGQRRNCCRADRVWRRVRASAPRDCGAIGCRGRGRCGSGGGSVRRAFRFEVQSETASLAKGLVAGSRSPQVAPAPKLLPTIGDVRAAQCRRLSLIWRRTVKVDRRSGGPARERIRHLRNPDNGVALIAARSRQDSTRLRLRMRGSCVHGRAGDRSGDHGTRRAAQPRHGAH